MPTLHENFLHKFVCKARLARNEDIEQVPFFSCKAMQVAILLVLFAYSYEILREIHLASCETCLAQSGLAYRTEMGAAVAERLACSPPTKGEPGFNLPAGSLPNFRPWESCRTKPLLGRVLSGISRFPRPFIPAQLRTHLNSPPLDKNLQRACTVNLATVYFDDPSTRASPTVVGVYEYDIMSQPLVGLILEPTPRKIISGSSLDEALTMNMAVHSYVQICRRQLRIGCLLSQWKATIVQALSRSYHTPKPSEVKSPSVASMQCEICQITKMVEICEKPPHHSCLANHPLPLHRPRTSPVLRGHCKIFAIDSTLQKPV
ncbi:hypothetical protein PR048_031585 [Dryococelus australis]|uniref:Uncharacterized protein n=1 Tax=Dryococelus australis TaxID=614101 RepID=A0ABQ9G6R4_9NEOP|nr:hypothetical protein PR048_031585 [Dryococelus australis]